MKRVLVNKISLALAAAAIFLVGMLHDPDLAKGDDLDAAQVPHEYLPGYQCNPDASQSQPLTAAEVAKLNMLADSAYDTF